jgi:hypothetical protein
MAESVAVNGFCVCVGGENRWARNPTFLYNFLAGGFNQMLKQWGENRGHTPLVVYVSAVDKGKAESYTEVFNNPLFFSVTFEKLAKLRPLAVAFEMVSFKKEPNVTTDRLIWTEDTSTITVRGTTRIGLETMVNILMAPQNRKILLSPVRKPKKQKVR